MNGNKVFQTRKETAKLYKISVDAITSLLQQAEESDGQHQIVELVAGVKYPLKVVYVVENKTITVITNYPLKKVVEK